MKQKEHSQIKIRARMEDRDLGGRRIFHFAQLWGMKEMIYQSKDRGTGLIALRYKYDVLYGVGRCL
jgi:hypothetical protein